MTIESSISLQPFNTFGVDVLARHYVKVASVDEIRRALAWAHDKAVQVYILGGGSNILFTQDIDGLVIHMGLKGIEKHGPKKVSSKNISPSPLTPATNAPATDAPDTGNPNAASPNAASPDAGTSEEETYLVTIAAGEDWSETVWWAASNGLGGIENLYLIPGTAGAAAVQNIGAYGVELCDVCHHVTVLHRPTGTIQNLTAKDCQFGYRESLFKHQPGVWIVLSITLALSPKSPLKTSYGTLKETLDRQAGCAPTYTDVACAVAAIRESKLPSPDTIGSAGSYFKNPVVPPALYENLVERYPGIPSYRLENGNHKLSASWLLDTAGWKQKDCATVGCYPLQPLVLVNKGKATGQEILRFSEDIQQDIVERFGITLEREVVIYP